MIKNRIAYYYYYTITKYRKYKVSKILSARSSKSEGLFVFYLFIFFLFADVFPYNNNVVYVCSLRIYNARVRITYTRTPTCHQFGVV